MTQTIFHTKTYLPRNEIDCITDVLYEKGICELIKTDWNQKEENPIHITQARKKIEQILSLLSEFKIKTKKKKGTNICDANKYIKQIDDIVNEFLPIIGSKTEKIDRCNSTIKSNTEKIKVLKTLPEIDLKLLNDSVNFRAITGFILTKNVSELRHIFKNEVKYLKDHGNKTLIILILKKDQDDSQLHEIGIEEIEIPKVSTPKELISQLTEENFKLKLEIKNNKLLLKEISENNYDNFETLHEQIKVYEQKLIETKKIGSSSSVVLMEAWVPERSYKEFKSTLGKNFVIESEEKKEAPTLFDNPKLFQPFEMLTKLYSPPKYKQFDPTIILALSFSIFFGFMLADIGYGIIMIILSSIILKKSNQKDFAKILIWCGATTTILGVVFGSFFGDILNLPKLIDPMKDVTTMMMIAIVAGILHITIGLFVGLIQNIKNKKYLNAVKSQLVWIIFLTSIILYTIKQNQIATILLILSVIMQFTLSIIESGFVMGIMSIFNFTGFVGDIFSYARLMALAIGSVGIALAFNFMTLLVKDIPYIGFLLATIIFLIGHAFNIIMNGLGSFIHSLRLEFLEHFSKYYEGNGKMFKPFLANRIKTEVKV